MIGAKPRGSYTRESPLQSLFSFFASYAQAVVTCVIKSRCLTPADASESTFGYQTYISLNQRFVSFLQPPYALLHVGFPGAFCRLGYQGITLQWRF